MAATVTVQITQEDIDAGRPSHPRDCPVARAISRAFGRPARADGTYYRLLGAEGMTIRYEPLPHDVVGKMWAFDDTGVMEPFSFELPAYVEGETVA